MSRRSRPTDGPGLDGILVVAKPAGPTSHDVVALIRRLAVTRRVGHGGTLDPFATGVLPRVPRPGDPAGWSHLGDRKRYRATICFGATLDADDLDGELTPVDGSGTGPAGRRSRPRSHGRIDPPGVPPAYSAIKLGGRRAYALARAGETPRLAPREVTIDRLELIDWDGSEPDRPIAVVEVDCSAGTYVRSIARDVGAATGGAAYLGALTRTASGGFVIEGAYPLDAIRAASADGQAGLLPLLLPIDAGLGSLRSGRPDRARDRRHRARPVRPSGSWTAGAGRPG